MEKIFEASSTHWGEYKMKSETFGFNTIVITGMIQGQKKLRFGRIVQVRKKSGAYGSDTILVREAGGELCSYHNMGFFSIKKEFLPLYEEAMKDTPLDEPDTEYSIEGNNLARGFVVEGLDDTGGKIHVSDMIIKVHKG